MTRDIFTDIAAIVHPLAPRPMDDPDADEWYNDYYDQVMDKRESYSHNLMTAWEAEDDLDPLLSAISEARHRKANAEADIRKLIAYGREFVKPRPYRLTDLATAAGMSISGTRTAYEHGEVATVAEDTGAPPREWRAPAEKTDGLTPMKPQSAQNVSVSECGCQTAWPLIYTIIDELALYVCPSNNVTPTCALYDAWCLGCGTLYTGNWRIASFVELPREWTHCSNCVPWRELGESCLLNGDGAQADTRHARPCPDHETGPAITSWVYKVGRQ